MNNDNNPIKLERSIFKIKENEYVNCKNKIYKISTILNFSEVIGIDIETKRPKKLFVNELTPLKNQNDNISIFKDFSDITNQEFFDLEKKYLAIEPILTNSISKKDIEKYSKKIGVHFTTLYRWLRNYKSTGTLAGLLSKPSGRKEGENKLNLDTEEVIKNTIESYYLTVQKPSIQATITKVFDECTKRNIPLPSKNTIRNRIKKISEYKVLKKRGSSSIARTKFHPVPGKFEKQYPLELIQIDHTTVDLQLVDDESREVIGRAYLSIAIDVYSRMIVGYYLSLNPVSVTSVAMCITNTILPKEKTLLDLDIDTNWDVWGIPNTIHVDNGSDFRSNTLREAGLLHGINIEFRPIKKTHYGGHVESVIKTLMKATHLIPGTTFSDIVQKGEYNSEKKAILTFHEYEKWLVTYITKVYNKTVHSKIGMSPEELWEVGLFGGEAPIGLLPKPSNPDSILIDFLPTYKRTIQKNGVNLDNINYYDNILRNKINVLDEKSKKKKKFTFKRDPRNIKYLWFYDDSTKEYYKINAADQSMPEVPLWEYELIKSSLKKKRIKKFHTFHLIEAREELDNQIEMARKKSKKARRIKQRNKNKSIELDENKKNIINKKEKIDDSIWEEDIPDFG